MYIFTYYYHTLDCMKMLDKDVKLQYYNKDAWLSLTLRVMLMGTYGFDTCKCNCNLHLH